MNDGGGLHFAKVKKKNIPIVVRQTRHVHARVYMRAQELIEHLSFV